MTIYRRDMLKAGIAVGAGMMLVPASTRCQESAANEELNVGVIGIGLQGRSLINAALKMAGVRFRAACDIWEFSQRYAEYYLANYGHKVNTYADYREMLDKEPGLDAVIVASPDFVHAEQVNASLKAGRHVYCEPMMSNTVDGARSMVRTMQETGKLLQVGYQRRSNPRYLHAYGKLLQEANLLGRIGNVNTQWVFALDDDRGWPRRNVIPDDVLRKNGYADMRQFRNWRWFKKYSGGLFGNLGGHQLDVVNWFLGATPTSVAATGGGRYDPATQWHKNVMAMFEYEPAQGPVQAFCQMLTDTRADGSGAHERFLGTNGSLTISQNPRWTAIYRDPEAPEWDDLVALDYLQTKEQERVRKSERKASDVAETGIVETYRLPVELDNPVVYPHLLNFFEAVRGKTELNCPADVAFRTDVVAFKTVEAIAARKTLEIPSGE
ncbi:MAG: Gfo/Idh/MocA family oxidoreductase [Pirellulaceae bacterium]